MKICKWFLKTKMNENKDYASERILPLCGMYHSFFHHYSAHWCQGKSMVFHYQNCFDLLWEKIVLVFEKFEAEGREFSKY